MTQPGGYGDGLYSAEDYGTPRSDVTIIPIDMLPNAWTLDNFGQILLAMTSPDSRLLQWDPSGGGTGVPDAVMTQVTSTDTGTGFAPNRAACSWSPKNGSSRYSA